MHCNMLCYAMLCSSMLCYVFLCYAMLCYAVLCFAILYYAMHTMLCFAILCYATLCYAMLCTAMLCYAVLYYTIAMPTQSNVVKCFFHIDPIRFNGSAICYALIKKTSSQAMSSSSCIHRYYLTCLFSWVNCK